MRRTFFIAVALTLAIAPGSAAQEVFRSVQSALLPTGEVLPAGSWLFEISHRFDLPVSDGRDALWGLDGTVRNRIGLSYSATDQLVFGVGRSNFHDNIELNVKFVPLSLGAESLPVKIGAMGGVAWNTELSLVEGAEDNELQAYAQLLVNALIADRVALGVVPSYLHNRRVRDFSEVNTVSIGLQGQVFVTPALALIGEWIITEEGLDIATTTALGATNHDTGAFGLEITTRGHVFKIVLSNNPRMSTTHVLAGANYEFEPDTWRPGFNITRLLPF